jgi:hypothetical protein
MRRHSNYEAKKFYIPALFGVDDFKNELVSFDAAQVTRRRMSINEGGCTLNWIPTFNVARVV